MAFAGTLSAVTNGTYVTGNKVARTFDVTLSSSFASGEPLVASDVKLKKLIEVRVHGPFRKSDNTAAISVSYDHTNGKFQAYQGKDPGAAGGADVPLQQIGTVDLSGYSGRVTFVGYR